MSKGMFNTHRIGELGKQLNEIIKRIEKIERDIEEIKNKIR